MLHMWNHIYRAGGNFHQEKYLPILLPALIGKNFISFSPVFYYGNLYRTGETFIPSNNTKVPGLGEILFQQKFQLYGSYTA